jgi:phosphatidylserine decarboxylase
MNRSPLERLMPPLQADAWRVMPWFALATLVLFWVWVPLGWIGIAGMIWCASLFREPPRAAPLDLAATIGPMDGTITEVGSALPPVELGLAGGELRCVSIELGPLDSHVLRSPADGKLVRLNRPYPGDGERVAIRIAAANGEVGVMIRATGPGRRVRLAVAEGQTLRLGETIGVVLFAGDADVYLPAGTEPFVTAGQKVVGGETILGTALAPPRP